MNLIIQKLKEANEIIRAWFETNWFKAGLLTATALAGLSVFYYYTFQLPAQQASLIKIQQEQQNLSDEDVIKQQEKLAEEQKAKEAQILAQKQEEAKRQAELERQRQIEAQKAKEAQIQKTKALLNTCLANAETEYSRLNEAVKEKSLGCNDLAEESRLNCLDTYTAAFKKNDQIYNDAKTACTTRYKIN